jgi:uncharacterized protein YbjT (DUF2867 family)
MRALVVGRHRLHRLRTSFPGFFAAGHDVAALIRPSSDGGRSFPRQCYASPGSMDDRESLEGAMRGRDTLVCIASESASATPTNLVAAARTAGVRRALFISTDRDLHHPQRGE